MVEIEAVADDNNNNDTKATETAGAFSRPSGSVDSKGTEKESKPDEVLASEERILDALAIEEAAASMKRPSARAHLESLAKKLRRESEALRRVEESRAKLEASSMNDGSAQPAAATTKAESAATPSPSVTASAIAAPVPPSAKYTPIDRFSFDAGGYNSPTVTVYVPLPSVGSIPRENVTCDFTPATFDLIVRDLKGKSYRLFKDNLDKDIDPKTSKIIVKPDRIIVKLGKVKGEYGMYDHWSGLTAKKKKKVGADGKTAKEDPSASIMELMKEMYEEGDDNMKKMIGETMLKQRRGELGGKDGGLGLDDDLDKL